MFFSKANKVKVAQAAFNFNANKPRGRDLDPWIPGTAGNTTSTVEISISCRNLADKDILSKSDPMVVVYNRPPGSRSWIQFMRTETIQDDLNPDFATKATMEYRFEQVQQLRFEVYDIDSETVKLTKQDNIGFIDVTLGQIVSAGEEGLIMELLCLKPFVIGQDNSKPNGTIILTAEELSSVKDEVFLKLSGTNIGKWSGFLPPKTFFSVSKMNEARRYFVVHRSSGARGQTPAYAPLRIPLRTLCNGDRNRELRIEIFQLKFRGALVHCGQVNTCLAELLKYAPEDKLQLHTPTGATMNSFLKVLACAVNPVSTFVDFIHSGTQIHCCFAIDFTISNGDPSDSQSLHYIAQNGNQPNSYEQAIQAVGTILKDYDTSSSFPCYGFGARIPPKGEISYDFFVTLAKSPNCLSVPGVLEAYRSCVQKIQLFGPTNFAPVIRAISDVASKTKPGENYYILVILTDGVITDVAQTKKAIVTASHLPLSIVVIGVGEADFDVMEELDGDAVRVSYKRKQAVRDIVQFVAYRSARSWMSATGESTGTEKMAHDYEADVAVAAPPPPPEYDEDGEPIEVVIPVVPQENTQPAPHETKQDKTHRLAQSQLAREVLAEIPEQICGYMRMKGILPNMITKQSVQADAFALMENPEDAEPPPEVV